MAEGRPHSEPETVDTLDVSKARTNPGRLGLRVAAGMLLPVGTMIKHHEIIRPLGRGGMGQVYLARDLRLGRLVALKFLMEGTHTQRFIAEARATARLTHENIVAIHDIDEHQGASYMVLEYVAGQMLQEWLAARNAAA